MGDPFSLLGMLKGDIINVKDKMGRTALHIAAFYGHKGNVETLINLGADINAEDNLKMA